MQITARQALGPGGILREVREPQIQMGELVEACLAAKKSAIIEGGTGTGKSFGYLVPAMAGGHKTLVSTHTKALQDQIFQNDVPFLQRAFAERGWPAFTAAVLKGASNYLCNRKADEAGAGLFPELSHLPTTVQRWITGTTTGDLADGPAELTDQIARQLAVDTDDCQKKKCPFYGSCHYRRARDKAADADLAIVNHALLARAITSPFLMELSNYSMAIIDEGHQFEEVAREAFGGKLTPGKIRAFVATVESYITPSEREAENDRFAAAERAEWIRLRDAFRKAVMAMMLPWMDPADKSKDLLVSIDFVRHQAEPAGEALEAIAFWLRQRLKEDNAKHKRLGRQLDALGDFFAAISGKDVIAVARREVVQGERYAKVTLETFPLNVGERLKTDLYAHLQVIYTSATIAVGDSFDQAIAALGLPGDVDRMVLDSPFDYAQKALLYVPRGIPEANDARYLPTLRDQVQQLVTVSNGGAFVLFTSHKTLKAVYDLCKNLPFPMRMQDNTPKGQLIDWFKRTPNAILFATASFWEGVSIEGSDLRLVVIEKIPFPPPSDPILQAKGALIKARGASEFNALSVPSAIIKLKQGFGRLIRTKTDAGVVAILDSRIHGKPYGGKILRALPPARLVDELDEAVFAPYLTVDRGDREEEVTTEDEVAIARPDMMQGNAVVDLAPQAVVMATKAYTKRQRYQTSAQVADHFGELERWLHGSCTVGMGGDAYTLPGIAQLLRGYTSPNGMFFFMVEDRWFEVTQEEYVAWQRDEDPAGPAGKTPILTLVRPRPGDRVTVNLGGGPGPATVLDREATLATHMAVKVDSLGKIESEVPRKMVVAATPRLSAWDRVDPAIGF